MKLHSYVPYDICTHYICALVNDDWSGLDDDDTALLETFADTLPQPCTIDVSDNEPSFMRDDVSGLMADCVAVNIWRYKS